MAASADFIEFLKDQLRGLGHVTSRRMFSGAGIYCDGVIFALLLRDTLYFKVDDGNRAAYEAEGLKPFSYQAKGRTMEVKAYWREPRLRLDSAPRARSASRSDENPDIPSPHSFNGEGSGG